MKKFITLICLSAFIVLGVTYHADAQKSKQGTLLSTSGKGLDTLANAGTEVESLSLNGYFGIVTIQTVFRKISGTAAATATLRGSIDGINYYAIGSPYTVTDVASQNVAFKIVPSEAKYYQLTVVGTGTQSLEIKPLYIARHPSD